MSNTVNNVYVSSTKAAPNAATTSQTTSKATSSNKAVSKLSASEKRSLEKKTGVTINTDADLIVAKTKLLASKEKDTVTITGTSSTTALISGDKETVDTLNRLLADIESIEATRDDCPGLDFCNLDGAGLLAKKALAAFLESARAFADKLNQVKQWLENGLSHLVNSDFLDAWLRCTSYLSKKGMEGIRQLNKVSKVVNALDDPAVLLTYAGIITDTANASMLGDPKTYLTENLKTKKSSLSLSDMIDLCTKLNVNLKNVMNPFDSISASSDTLLARTNAMIVDSKNFGSVMGNKAPSKTVAQASRVRTTRTVTTTTTVTEDINLDSTADEKRAMAILAEAVNIQNEDAPEITYEQVAMSQQVEKDIAIKNTHLLSTCASTEATVANADYQESYIQLGLVAAQTNSTIPPQEITELTEQQSLVYAQLAGYVVADTTEEIDNTTSILTMEDFQCQLMGTSQLQKSSNVTDVYLNLYDNISYGYA